MLFSSLTFLFCFLSATVGIYYLVRRELRNIVLLLASIFFYAWGEPRYLPVIFTTITISYVGALVVEKFKFKKLLLALFILLDLSLLFYFITVTPKLNFIPIGTLPEIQGKAKRVVKD